MKMARKTFPAKPLLIAKGLLIFLGLILTNHFVVPRVDYFLDFDLYFPLTVFFGIWAAAIIAIFYVAFTPLKRVRIFWAVLIGLSTMAAETYFLIAHERITIEALDAMWDPSLVSVDILAFYGQYFLKALLSTSVLLIGLLIPPPPARMLHVPVLAFIPVVPCLLLGGLIYYVGAATGNETRGLPSQFLNLSLFTIFAISDSPSMEKSEVNIPFKGMSSLQHIILIVDESVSGDFIDLNVPRGTTPFLASQADSVANFGLATSASNCSNASNAVLRLGANPLRLGPGHNNILTNPSVWKYARNAGFETNFVEAQQISAGRQNYMNEKELELIDHILTCTNHRHDQRDDEMVEKISEILRRPEPQFIFVNKYGAHFPYHRSYPENEAIFKPVMRAYETISDRESLVNTYKNAIRWSVDRFFELLLAETDLSNGVIIYTSDHGQNLLDDGKPVTHCRRSSETVNEAVVPLLVWTENAALQRKFDRAAKKNRNAASHFEVFPTILTLFGYDPKIVRERYHQNLFESIDQPLGFTSGPITGRFGRHPVWNSREGLVHLER